MTENQSMEAHAMSDLEKAYWQALNEGKLIFQSCSDCGHNWLPPREDCPSCLGHTWSWKKTSGNGKLISWTIYHIAYHPEFADRLPYNVAIVELEEGPRLVTNITNPDASGGLQIKSPVTLTITPSDRGNLALFQLDNGS